MNLWDSSVLFLIMLILASNPSTSVGLVVTRSALLGFSHGAAVSLGIVLGDVVFALLAIFGLTALAELMGALFLVIKLAAGGYLIWFGLTLMRNRSKEYSFRIHGARGGIVGSILAGLLVTLADVKAIFFYASMFPIFVDMSALTTGDTLVILLVTSITVGGVKLSYAVAANKLVTITEGLALEKQAKQAAGILMASAGAYLITKA